MSSKEITFLPNKQQFSIQEIQKKFPKIPKDYLYFLSKTDGGDIDNTITTFTDKTDYDVNAKINYFLSIQEQEGIDTIQSYKDTFTRDWYYDDEEHAKNLLPIIDANIIIAFDFNRGGEIRPFYMDGSYTEYVDNYDPIAPTFTDLLKLIIDQNGGYIKNLSEIYDELKEMRESKEHTNFH